MDKCPDSTSFEFLFQVLINRNIGRMTNEELNYFLSLVDYLKHLAEQDKIEAAYWERYTY